MSEVSICSQALSLLGVGSILALDPEEGPEAALCATNYAPLRDALLSEASWSFATRRYQLTPVVNEPAYGYGQKFLLPTEVLTVIEASADDFHVNGASTMDWRLEEGHIVANATRVYAKCIIRIVDTSKFSASFTNALVARLAAEFSPTFTESNTKTQQMWELYNMKLAIALPVDGRQGKSDLTRGGSLIRVR